MPSGTISATGAGAFSPSGAGAGPRLSRLRVTGKGSGPGSGVVGETDSARSSGRRGTVSCRAADGCRSGKGTTFWEGFGYFPVPYSARISSTEYCFWFSLS